MDGLSVAITAKDSDPIKKQVLHKRCVGPVFLWC